jgi:thiol-disulfide isomerase/thioredoxin
VRFLKRPIDPGKSADRKRLADPLQLEGQTWFNTAQPVDNLAPGKVTLVEFWTFGCSNCRNTIPHMRELWSRLGEQERFQFVGVHRPEFAYEADLASVEHAINDLGVKWPVLIDNDADNWDRFRVRYWPSFYVFDMRGRIVHRQIGEGRYDEMATVLVRLLGEGSGRLAG